MTTISFSGFYTGERVTIDDVTVPEWNVPPVVTSVWDVAASPGVTLNITTERAEAGLQVAPEFARFKPTMSGFDTNVNQADETNHQPALLDKYYFWDFGEGYNYGAPTQVIAVDAADGGDRANSRYTMGFHGDHVFRQHGTTFTVRLAVYEPSSGKWGQAETTFSTGDPDVLYAGSATLFVDTNGAAGGYPNSPSGAQNFDNMDAALTALNAASTPHRIVFERGQSHQRSSVFTFQPSSGGTVSFRMEAVAGAGAKPIISSTQSSGSDGALFGDRTKGSGAGSTASTTVFKELDLRSTWNVVDETGYWDCTLLDSLDFGAKQTVVDRCDMSDCLRCISVTVINNRDRQVCAVDTTMTGWSDYGIFGGSIGDPALLGCRIAQDVDANAGGPKPPPDTETNNNHGPIRFTDAREMTVTACDLFSNTGWTTIPNGQQSMQPCLRSHTSTNGSGRRSVVFQNVMESGNQCYNPAAANSSSNDFIQNTLVEGNLMMSGAQAQRVAVISHSGMELRNNIMVMAGTAVRDRTAQEFVYGSALANNSTTENNQGPIRIRNNDLINFSPAPMDVFNTQNGRFTGDIDTNNLIDEPNLSTPNRPYTPLSPLQLVLPRLKGYKDISTPLLDDREIPDETGERQRPQLGSDAVDGEGNQIIGAVDFLQTYTVAA